MAEYEHRRIYYYFCVKVMYHRFVSTQQYNKLFILKNKIETIFPHCHALKNYLINNEMTQRKYLSIKYLTFCKFERLQSLNSFIRTLHLLYFM